jgi:hypothetical protein
MPVRRSGAGLDIDVILLGTVTVTPASPVVDVRTTSVSTNLGKEASLAFKPIRDSKEVTALLAHHGIR